MKLFFIGDSSYNTKNIIINNPSYSGFGTCIFHPWVFAINLTIPYNWSSLCKSQSKGWNQNIHTSPTLLQLKLDQCGDVAHKMSIWRIPAFMSHEMLSKNVYLIWRLPHHCRVFIKALVDYESLHIRLTFCLSTYHLINGCKELQPNIFPLSIYTKQFEQSNVAIKMQWDQGCSSI